MTDLVDRIANILAGHFFAVGVQMEGPMHGLRPEQKRKCMDAAIAVKETVLEAAERVVEDHAYMLSLNPDEGPLTKQDRVCKETREQAVAALRNLRR